MKGKTYNMGFTSSALMFRESHVVASCFQRLGEWQKTYREILQDNLLQSRSPTTAKRLAQEVIKRLQTLNAAELEIVSTGHDHDARQILWLAVCRRYQFVADFAKEVLNEHFVQFNLQISEADYYNFFNQKAAWHPELDRLSRTSEKKIKQVLFRMMREAELLDEENRIIPTLFSEKLQKLINRIPKQQEFFAVR